jgi:hypothetical protein
MSRTEKKFVRRIVAGSVALALAGGAGVVMALPSQADKERLAFTGESMLAAGVTISGNATISFTAGGLRKPGGADAKGQVDVSKINGGEWVLYDAGDAPATISATAVPPEPKDTKPVNATWAKASATNGNVKFSIPVITGASCSSSATSATTCVTQDGATTGRRFWVAQTKAPQWTGSSDVVDLDMVSYMRTGAVGLMSDSWAKSEMLRPYRFITNGITAGGTQASGKESRTSSTAAVDFMSQTYGQAIDAFNYTWSETSVKDPSFMRSSGVWPTVWPNPPALQMCGTEASIVLDYSGSVTVADYKKETGKEYVSNWTKGWVGPGTKGLRSATKATADALLGTNSRMSLFTFGDKAPAQNTGNSAKGTDTWLYPNQNGLAALTGVKLQTATTAAQLLSDATKLYPSDFSMVQGTNWDRGLAQVADANATSLSKGTRTFETVYFVTDGNPTYYGFDPVNNGKDVMMKGSTSTIQNGVNRFREVEEAIFSSNWLKSQGTHVTVLAVGSQMSATALANAAAISGPKMWAPEATWNAMTAADTAAMNTIGIQRVESVSGADIIRVTDFKDLESAMRKAVLDTCIPSLTVVKLVESTDAKGKTQREVSQGWNFKVTPDKDATMQQTTNADGAAEFDLEYGTRSLRVEETFDGPKSQDGSSWEMVRQNGEVAVCEWRDVNGNHGDMPSAEYISDSGNPSFTVDLDPENLNVMITCNIVNRKETPPAVSMTATAQRHTDWDWKVIKEVIGLDNHQVKDGFEGRTDFQYGISVTATPRIHPWTHIEGSVTVDHSKGAWPRNLTDMTLTSSQDANVRFSVDATQATPASAVTIKDGVVTLNPGKKVTIPFAALVKDSGTSNLPKFDTVNFPKSDTWAQSVAVDFEWGDVTMTTTGATATLADAYAQVDGKDVDVTYTTSGPYVTLPATLKAMDCSEEIPCRAQYTAGIFSKINALTNPSALYDNVATVTPDPTEPPGVDLTPPKGSDDPHCTPWWDCQTPEDLTDNATVEVWTRIPLSITKIKATANVAATHEWSVAKQVTKDGTSVNAPIPLPQGLNSVTVDYDVDVIVTRSIAPTMELTGKVTVKNKDRHAVNLNDLRLFINSESAKDSEFTNMDDLVADKKISSKHMLAPGDEVTLEFRATASTALVEQVATVKLTTNSTGESGDGRFRPRLALLNPTAILTDTMDGSAPQGFLDALSAYQCEDTVYQGTDDAAVVGTGNDGAGAVTDIIGTVACDPSNTPVGLLVNAVDYLDPIDEHRPIGSATATRTFGYPVTFTREALTNGTTTYVNRATIVPANCPAGADIIAGRAMTAQTDPNDPCAPRTRGRSVVLKPVVTPPTVTAVGTADNPTDYAWSLTKEVDRERGWVKRPGSDTMDVNYTISMAATPIPLDAAAWGTLTVSNPDPLHKGINLNTLAIAVSGYNDATVMWDLAEGPAGGILPGGSTLAIPFWIDFPGHLTEMPEVTVSLGGVKAPATVSWAAEAPKVSYLHDHASLTDEFVNRNAVLNDAWLTAPDGYTTYTGEGATSEFATTVTNPEYRADACTEAAPCQETYPATVGADVTREEPNREYDNVATLTPSTTTDSTRPARPTRPVVQPSDGDGESGDPADPADPADTPDPTDPADPADPAEDQSTNEDPSTPEPTGDGPIKATAKVRVWTRTGSPLTAEQGEVTALWTYPWSLEKWVWDPQLAGIDADGQTELSGWRKDATQSSKPVINSADFEYLVVAHPETAGKGLTAVLSGSVTVANPNRWSVVLEDIATVNTIQSPMDSRIESCQVLTDLTALDDRVVAPHGFKTYHYSCDLDTSRIDPPGSTPVDIQAPTFSVTWDAEVANTWIDSTDGSRHTMVNGAAASGPAAEWDVSAPTKTVDVWDDLAGGTILGDDGQPDPDGAGLTVREGGVRLGTAVWNAEGTPTYFVAKAHPDITTINEQPRDTSDWTFGGYYPVLRHRGPELGDARFAGGLLSQTCTEHHTNTAWIQTKDVIIAQDIARAYVIIFDVALRTWVNQVVRDGEVMYTHPIGFTMDENESLASAGPIEGIDYTGAGDPNADVRIGDILVQPMVLFNQGNYQRVRVSQVTYYSELTNGGLALADPSSGVFVDGHELPWEPCTPNSANLCLNWPEGTGLTLEPSSHQSISINLRVTGQGLAPLDEDPDPQVYSFAEITQFDGWVQGPCDDVRGSLPSDAEIIRKVMPAALVTPFGTDAEADDQQLYFTGATKADGEPEVGRWFDLSDVQDIDSIPGSNPATNSLGELDLGTWIDNEVLHTPGMLDNNPLWVGNIDVDDHDGERIRLSYTGWDGVPYVDLPPGGGVPLELPTPSTDDEHGRGVVEDDDPSAWLDNADGGNGSDLTDGSGTGSDPATGNGAGSGTGQSGQNGQSGSAQNSDMTGALGNAVLVLQNRGPLTVTGVSLVGLLGALALASGVTGLMAARKRRDSEDAALISATEQVE